MSFVPSMSAPSPAEHPSSAPALPYRQSTTKCTSVVNNTTVPSSSPVNSNTTFEFTKRKRWADLLVHDLSEAIIFVLSNDAKIWFCGRAVSELLGWRDAELIDRGFADLVNAEDRQVFRSAFEESLRTRTEMNSYVRLKSRNDFAPQDAPQAEVLFEIKGYPHFIENELTARCLFAVAKPYPSRNIAMLNTLLELKTENERLQRRLAELRVSAPSPPAPISGPSVSSMYPPGTSTARSSVPSVTLQPIDNSGSYYSSHQPKSYDDFIPPVSQMRANGYDSLSMHSCRGQHPPSSAPPGDDDLGDDSSRRKKMRKMHTTEQYVCVTCGRTDSPEWRKLKGPQGPKTLCNACGLRWAKEVRNKVDEAAGASTGANTA
ncbi:hypothetical protein HYDPIDRAFT_105726 [Hydnomerulius pinastri MD-312]|nr:hypothetical protein HYDPIDRAFT_105726 [Hydnomerulius pinastri MD-312]